jgi:DNA-binding GntR family transcriptional regulator
VNRVPELETRTLAEQVAARLREAVLSGQLPAGERLSQERLAEQYGVSRVPIRDALRHLQAEGLIESHPRLGTTVAQLSAADLDELYDMRLALEPALARLATANLRRADIAAMRRQLDAMTSAPALSAEWFSAHDEFHNVLNARAGRDRMFALVERLRAQTERYLRMYRSAIDRADEHGAEHELISAAAESGDPERVAATVHEHLVLVRDRVLAYLEAHRPNEEVR